MVKKSSKKNGGGGNEDCAAKSLSTTGNVDSKIKRTNKKKDGDPIYEKGTVRPKKQIASEKGKKEARRE